MFDYFLLLVCLISAGAVVKCKDVCYNDLGCFTDSRPFSGTLQRPIAMLPESPQKVGTFFILYNRRVPAGELITASVLGDNYDPSLETKFIVHGFIQHANKKWIVEMKDALLTAGDYNVITTDWSKGDGFPYTQATANTQIAGAEIAKLVASMVNNKGARIRNFHCIGHSLGSHVCGYAGKRLPGLGRITGLDPAGPYFENTDVRVRLDKSDAQYVDVIHTDGTANLLLGLGLMQQIGHADFYPNGGKDQPDCPATSGKLLSAIFGLISIDMDVIEDTMGCSHIAAYLYYTDSIINKECAYTSYSCKSEKDFKSGKCIKCSSLGCNRMGFWSSPSNDTGVLHLNTKDPLLKDKLCQQNFGVTLVSNKLSGQGQAAGRFTVYFETSSEETSSTEILDDNDVTFKKDSTEQRLVSLGKHLESQIDRVVVSYTKTSNILTSWLYDNQWSFSYIDVTHGDRQTTTRYCPTSTYIQSGQTGVFTRC